MRILLVDDETPLREVVQSMLEASNHQIVTAENGKDALAKFRGHNESSKDGFDLLITDCNMPEMDGIELTKSIKSISPQMRVIMITGNNNEGLEKFAQNAGVESLINKPFKREELVTAVDRNTVNSSQPPPQPPKQCACA